MKAIDNGINGMSNSEKLRDANATAAAAPDQPPARDIMQQAISYITRGVISNDSLPI